VKQREEKKFIDDCHNKLENVVGTMERKKIKQKRKSVGKVDKVIKYR
jgi:flagellin-specific chaperone FliS